MDRCFSLKLKKLDVLLGDIFSRRDDNLYEILVKAAGKLFTTIREKKRKKKEQHLLCLLSDDIPQAMLHPCHKSKSMKLYFKSAVTLFWQETLCGDGLVSEDRLVGDLMKHKVI